MTLDANSKFVDDVTFADVENENVDDRLVTADCLATASQVWQQLDNVYLQFTIFTNIGSKLVVLLCIVFEQDAKKHNAQVVTLSRALNPWAGFAFSMF